MRLKFILAILLFSTVSQGATVVRMLPGNWSNPTGWFVGGVACGCIPTPADDVEVNTSSLLLNTNVTIKSITVITGNFIVGVGQQLTLTGNDTPLWVQDRMINDGLIEFSEVTSTNPKVLIDGVLENKKSIHIGNNLAGVGIEINGDLINQKVLTLGQTDNHGILINIGGILTNNFELSLIRTNGGNAIHVDGLFINTDLTTIDTTILEGVLVSSTGNLNNSDSLVIKNSGGNALQVNSPLTNAGTIIVEQAGYRGIVANSIINTGNIVVDSSSNTGILVSGTLTNNGTVLTQANGFDGVSILGTFTNNNKLVIGPRIAVSGLKSSGTIINNDSILINGASQYGSNTSGATLNNHYMKISNCENQALIVTGTGIFDNNSSLIIDATSTNGILNQNLFNNQTCGIIEIQNTITSSTIGKTFTNDNYILSGGPGTNTVNALVNNGIIYESNSAFIGTTMTNDGYLLTNHSGPLCEGGKITSAFSGTGLFANLLPPISSSAMHADEIATYDPSSNEINILPGAGGYDKLYFKFDQAGCVKTIAMNLSAAITHRYFRDLDMDGYGDPASPFCSPSLPSGYVDNDEDCADNDDQIYPNAPERCNGLDDNCDGNPESIVNIWTGSGDGITWSDGDNWSEGYEPLECQEVIIDLPSTLVKHISGDSAKIRKLSINLASITLEIEPSAQLIIEDQGITTTGQIINDGNLIINNSVNTAVEIMGQIDNNGILEIENAGNYGIRIHPLKKLINTGTVEIHGNIINSAIYNEAELNNLVMGYLHIHSIPTTTACIEVESGAFFGTITNEGSILLENGQYGIYNINPTSELVNLPNGSITIQNISKSAIANGKFDNEGIIEVDEVTEIALLNVNNSVNTGKISISNIDSTGIDVQGTFANLDTVLISNTIYGVEVSGTEYDNQGVTDISMSLRNGINISAGALYRNQGITDIENTTLNSINSSGELMNGGTIEIHGAGNKGISVGDMLENGTTGTLRIEDTGGQAIDLNTGSFLNQGNIIFKNIQNDALDLDNATGSVNMGTLTFQEGTLGFAIQGNSVLINSATGSIEGRGKIAGPQLNNMGYLKPGPPTQTFNFIDTYDHVNGTLDIEIDGYAGMGNNIGNDAITGSGPILLGGTLNVALGGSFQPVPGDTFTIVDAVNRVGNFATINLPTSYCMVVEYTPHNVNIIMPGLATGTWNGSINSDWFNPLNWNESCVPGPNTDVTIVVSTSMPEIGFGKIARVKTLMTHPSSTITIVDGSMLEILGM